MGIGTRRGKELHSACGPCRPRPTSRFRNGRNSRSCQFRCQGDTLPLRTSTHLQAWFPLVPAALRIILALSIALLLLRTAGGATAQIVPADPRMACDRAAARAERQWNLPTGLLAAIGTVESGLTDASGLHRRAWPWSINADGWSYVAASKTDAVNTVRVLQSRGIRLIDVGCFQVDLFYHPRAFSSLNEAFDPEANARAASDILLLGRFNATAWEPAIAAYHSASLLRGGWYLRQVLSAWPAARARLAVLDMSPGDLSGYVVLLSPAAALVRVVTPADTSPATAPGLPRVILPSDVPAQTRLIDVTGQLPRVLTPMEPLPRSRGRL